MYGDSSMRVGSVKGCVTSRDKQQVFRVSLDLPTILHCCVNRSTPKKKLQQHKVFPEKIDEKLVTLIIPGRIVHPWHHIKGK